jgi:hypothetical protein
LGDVEGNILRGIGRGGSRNRRSSLGGRKVSKLLNMWKQMKAWRYSTASQGSWCSVPFESSIIGNYFMIEVSKVLSNSILPPFLFTTL